MMLGFLPPVSTRQSWIDEIVFVDADDGTPIYLTGATVQVQIMLAAPVRERDGYGYAQSFNVGNFPPVALLATTADGTITLPDTGVAQFTFTAAQMGSLYPGQYVVGCKISRDGETVQVFILDMPVIDGVVPQ